MTPEQLLPTAQQLLARQAHLIDSGQAVEWAQTFLPNGEFISPTYDVPIVGHTALTEFARRLHADQPRLRHVLTTLYVSQIRSETEATTTGTLLIVTATDAGVTLNRVTTVHDDLTHTDHGWLLARRTVLPA